VICDWQCGRLSVTTAVDVVDVTVVVASHRMPRIFLPDAEVCITRPTVAEM
jgi:hypothetical protein